MKKSRFGQKTTTFETICSFFCSRGLLLLAVLLSWLVKGLCSQEELVRGLLLCGEQLLHVLEAVDFVVLSSSINPIHPTPAVWLGLAHSPARTVCRDACLHLPPADPKEQVVAGLVIPGQLFANLNVEGDSSRSHLLAIPVSRTCHDLVVN